MKKAKKIILHVEDDPVDQMAMERIVKENDLPYKLVSVTNGEEAIEYLNSGSGIPFLIMMDINMPRMNGRECLLHLKKVNELKCIPIVMFSSSHEQEDVRRCYQAGCAGFKVKPANYEELEKLLRNTLNYWEECVLPDNCPNWESNS